MELHHIGIACDNIEKKLSQIKTIHTITHCSDIVFDPEQDATLCLINIKGLQRWS